jgi:hypothetical protein
MRVRDRMEIVRSLIECQVVPLDALVGGFAGSRCSPKLALLYPHGLLDSTVKGHLLCTARSTACARDFRPGELRRVISLDYCPSVGVIATNFDAYTRLDLTHENVQIYTADCLVRTSTIDYQDNAIDYIRLRHVPSLFD